jgi:uncharacterized hydantoinase/oxoprolinase family protein
MHVKLWFWSKKNPMPRIVAHGVGDTLVRAAIACFAPVGEKTWCREDRDGQLYLTHGESGYCCEPDDGPGPRFRKSRERLAKVRVRL